MTGTQAQPAAERDGFAEWAIVELMGHRRLAGYLREVEIAGRGFLRLDIPTSEDTARRVAALSQPAPVQRWELPAAVEPDTETEQAW